MRPVSRLHLTRKGTTWLLATLQRTIRWVAYWIDSLNGQTYTVRTQPSIRCLYLPDPWSKNLCTMALCAESECLSVSGNTRFRLSPMSIKTKHFYQIGPSAYFLLQQSWPSPRPSLHVPVALQVVVLRPSCSVRLHNRTLIHFSVLPRT